MAESSNLENFSEHAKFVMTLRSEKILDPPISSSGQTQQPKSSILVEPEIQESKEKEELSTLAHIPKAPFPSALESPLPLDKKGIKMNEMLEMFKQVQINLPLLDAIKQVLLMPNFLRTYVPRNASLRHILRRRSNLPSRLVQYFNTWPHPNLRTLVLPLSHVW